MNASPLLATGAIGLAAPRLRTRRAHAAIRRRLNPGEPILFKAPAIYLGGVADAPTGVLVITDVRIDFEATAKTTPINTSSIQIPLGEVRSAALVRVGGLGTARAVEFTTLGQSFRFVVGEAEEAALLVQHLIVD